MKCRNCSSPAEIVMVDLGVSPLCQSFRTAEELALAETFYPLKVLVCDACLLAQVDEFATPEEIFGTYAYFSSYSDSWLDHSRRYVTDAIERFELDQSSQVVEVASNDGYLLRWFVEQGIPAYGIEPADNVAQAAEQVRGGEGPYQVAERRCQEELKHGRRRRQPTRLRARSPAARGCAAPWRDSRRSATAGANGAGVAAEDTPAPSGPGPRPAAAAPPASARRRPRVRDRSAVASGTYLTSVTIFIRVQALLCGQRDQRVIRTCRARFRVRWLKALPLCYRQVTPGR